MIEDINLDQYHDWWFDNALEFLGHLLEKQGINVAWDDGISFNPLNKSQVDAVIREIETLIQTNLKYPVRDRVTGQSTEKNRAYLPTMHKGKYVSFLAVITTDHSGDKKAVADSKKQLITAITQVLSKPSTGNKVCDICGRDCGELFKVSQTIYPVATGSLKSQCGIRKMETEYHCCALCGFLGSLEWLDSYPFACDHANRSHYLLFPKLENMAELHKFKESLRSTLNQAPYSNIISVIETEGGKREIYTKDEYSLLLSLLEKLWEKIDETKDLSSLLCDRWIKIKIYGVDAKYQTKNTYIEEIYVPHIERLKDIFENFLPYSDFIRNSFASPIRDGVSRDIQQRLSREDKALMSKGIILDDFKIFSSAFQIRQNCRLAVSKDALNMMIYLWRGYNVAV